MLVSNITLIGQSYGHFSIFNMAASHHLGFWRKWKLTTGKVTASLYVLVYQIWLRYVKGGRVMAICFHNAGWPPSCVFTEVKFECISGTSVFVSEPNFLWICAAASELKVNSQIAATAIFHFESRCKRKSRLTRIYLYTNFGEDTLESGRVMAIYVFWKRRPPPSGILLTGF